VIHEVILSEEFYIYMELIRVSFGIMGISGVGTSAVLSQNELPALLENIHDGRYITSMMEHSVLVQTSYCT
jgi:hypothetical protein